MSELIVSSEINAITIFTGNGLDSVLDKIQDQIKTIVPDIDTAKGRKEIASLARKVSSSKVLLDGAGKELVSEWKDKSKLVDAERKRARDFLDQLRDDVREPLKLWEAEQVKIAAAKMLAIKVENERIEALQREADIAREAEHQRRENILIEKERVAAEKERVIAEEEAAKVKEQEKIEHEESIRKEAAEQARLDVEREAQEKIEAANQREAQAIEQARQADLARLEQEQKAVQDRIAQEKKAKDAAADLERERVQKEAAEQAEIIRRERNTHHKGEVNSAAVAKLLTLGLDEAQAKKVVSAIVKGKIPNVTINY